MFGSVFSEGVVWCNLSVLCCIIVRCVLGWRLLVTGLGGITHCLQGFRLGVTFYGLHIVYHGLGCYIVGVIVYRLRLLVCVCVWVILLVLSLCVFVCFSFMLILPAFSHY